MSEHYFSKSPSGEFRTKEIRVALAGAEHTVVTAGGVFSPDHLDRGTEVLLRTLERLDQGEAALGAGALGEASAEQDFSKLPLLDLGCGWGPIALSAAIHHPRREVWAVDVNARSRELTVTNASGLGLRNIRVAAPEDVPEHLRFAEIHSNPPIRVGKEVLHGMLGLWLPRLVPGGAAYLVVAKHLGAESLQKWIAAQFHDLDVSRIARDRGFHIIEARRREGQLG